MFFSALFRILSTILEATGAERDRDEFGRL